MGVGAVLYGQLEDNFQIISHLSNDSLKAYCISARDRVSCVLTELR